MSTRSPSLRLRADMIRQRVVMGSQVFWVLKDPHSREFYYFSDREFAILELLDGQRTIADIAHECSRRFAPDYIASESLVGFLADVKEKNLLVAQQDCRPRSRVAKPDRRRWWQQPLAIRLPGFNPDRLLDAISPPLNILWTPTSALVACLMTLLAGMIVVTHFDTFVQHATITATRSGASGLLMLAVVLSLTKIIHEFAHALACKRFGGECREIGVMLLVGMPCLYCDVSDAWMLTHRWKRICISLAGMAAELVIASIAAFIWLFTADGAVRDICVTVMVVCSVTTVLFNGNPLLRYDGYFVLSDLLGIPNLAAESKGIIRQWARAILWGTSPPYVSVTRPNNFRRNLLLVTYGIASGFYRLVIYGVILSMLYRLAQSYEVGNLAGCLIVAAIIAWLIQLLRPLVIAPQRVTRQARWSARRPTLLLVSVGIVMLIALMIPLPHRIVAPMSLRPAHEQPVFVRVAGQLTDAVDAGVDVSGGDVIAWLSNPDVQRTTLQYVAELENLQTELAGLRRQRASDPQVAARIPIVTEAIRATRQRQSTHLAEAQRLTLRSPGPGRIYLPTVINASLPDAEDRQTWSGTPLSPDNRGAWLEEGTVLCMVGDGQAREALVLVRQQDISLIRVDQRVVLMLSDHRRGQLQGRVIEVASSPVDEVSEEFIATGLADEGKLRGRQSTFYQVRVALDDSEAILPIRKIGHVQIAVGHASIANRVARLLRESFL